MFSSQTGFSGTKRFQILRQLGSGGMGVVYEAIDHEHGTRVALKALRALDPPMLMRLKQEFRALQGIQHQNLVSLLELVHEDGHWFVTMELVDGTPITTYIRGDGRPPSGYDSTHADRDTFSLGPAGRPPAEPVAAPLDADSVDRLRACLLQLSNALEALHASGMVHRDIKPSNVLVTKAGRVVVLDFGLILDADRDQSSSASIVGTVDYMAPEQAAGAQVGPAADWYAFGVVLYEALTRQLPYAGTVIEVLQLKQTEAPSGPEELVECPADLAHLCRALLRVNPQRRPTSDEIAGWLGAPRTQSRPRFASAKFIGREAELGKLAAAFEAVRRGAIRMVLIDGRSGVGKTALVRHFTDQVQADVKDVVILRGRYYEREAVPYRTLDAVMDAMSRFLARLPAGEAEAFMPIDAGLLGALFPSLRMVQSLSDSTLNLPALDPRQLRERLFRALRELFVRLSRKRPLIVVFDDVQWADRDSQAAFGEAFRTPEGPTMLVLATMRAGHVKDVRLKAALGMFAAVAPVEAIHLDPLPPGEAHELAARLLGPGVDAETARAIADETEGYPLFIDVLVRHALLTPPSADRSKHLRLDEALTATIASLDGEAQLLLELVAVSGSPLAYDVAARAAGLDLSALTRSATALKSAHMARGTRLHTEDALEPYHGRVRELVVGKLSETTRRMRHSALARALESITGTEAEALYLHWRGAGEAQRAARYALTAARHANETLAFDRATRLYRAALELSTDSDERRKLWIGLGDALANAGNGPGSAEAFGQAVEGSAPQAALELKRRMAEQLLRSGRIDAGLAALRDVLAAVDLKMPRTPRTALAAFLWNRAVLALRGTGFSERRSEEIPPSDLTRVDASWTVAGVLGMVDTIRGAYFQTLHFRLAMRAGEPFRVARALGLEAAFSATRGNHTAKRTAQLVATGEALATRVGDPWVRGWVRGSAGVSATLEGRWADGLRMCDEAEVIFLDRCGGTAWELSTFRFFIAYALAFTGQMRELHRRVPAYARAAHERGDLYGAAAHHSALSTMAWLTVDDIDGARMRVQEAMREWSHSEFQVEHFWELLAACQTDLYAGDVRSAQARVDERWQPLERSLLLRVQLTGIESYQLRGRVALAAAALAAPSDRAALIAVARKQCRIIAREKSHWGTPLGALVEAGVAVQSGEPERAIEHLRSAVQGFDAAGMRLYAAAARQRLGTLIGGDEGRAFHAEVSAYMKSEAVAAPERMIAMLAPGFATG